MREKLQRFMQGRYGVDPLNHFLLGFAITSMIISMLMPRSWAMIISVLYLLGIVGLVWSYVRMLSREHQKRLKENVRFLEYKNRFLSVFKRNRKMLEERKHFHIYTCPSCRQKIRIPKGKGKIMVTCPKCKTEFSKKS